MNPDVTDLAILLDRSGSMEERRQDHEGGLRAFVRDQRALAGDVRLTFVQFDSHDPFELIYDRTPLPEVREDRLVLVPRGSTPLLEAMSRTLDHLGTRLIGEPPHPVVVMVITDGRENASRPAYTKARIKAQVDTRTTRDGWTILYLGANVDAFAEAGGLAIPSEHALPYAATPKGVHQAYASVGANIRGYRAAVGRGMTIGAAAASNLAFTEDPRRPPEPADDPPPPTTKPEGKV